MSQDEETLIDPSNMEIHVSSPDTTESIGDVSTPLSVDCDDFSDDESDSPLSKRSGSTSRRDRKQKALSPRSRECLRLKINHRERERMHDLNSSMDALRQVMPYAHGPSVKKLSKMATLLLARNYIILLTRSLEEMRRMLAEAYRNQALPPGSQLHSALAASFPPGLRLPNLDKHLASIPGGLPGFPPGGLLSALSGGGVPPPAPPPPSHPPTRGPPPVNHPPVPSHLNPHHVSSRLSPGGAVPAGGVRTSEGSVVIPPPVSTMGMSTAHIVHHPTPTMAFSGLAAVRTAAAAGGLPSLPTPTHPHHPHHFHHHLSAHYTGAPCSCVYCHLAAKSTTEALLKQA